MQIQKKSRSLFRKNGKKLPMTVIKFMALALSAKLTELTTAFILISEGYITADEIFLPVCKPWLIIRSGFFLLSFIISVCAFTSVYQTVCRMIYPDTKKNSLKTAFLIMLIKILSFAVLFLTVFCIYLSNEFLLKAYSAEYSEGLITVSFYLLIFSVIFFGLRMYVISGAFLAPFILLRDDEKGILGSLIQSFSCMRGHRMRFFGILISFIPYGIASLLIFPAPSAFSRLIERYGIFAADVLENGAYNYDYNL